MTEYGFLSGPPGSRVPQYESEAVPLRPEGGDDCPNPRCVGVLMQTQRYSIARCSVCGRKVSVGRKTR